MATLAFVSAHVEINSVDLSAFVTGVRINYSAEMLDETSMGDTTRTMKGGLKNWSMEIDFTQDFAASSPDVSLFSLVGSTFTVTVRPVKGTAVGATNPNYTGTGILESYPPLGNAVGELAMTTVSIQSAGALSRATA